MHEDYPVDSGISEAQNNIANELSLVLWKPHGIGLFLRQSLCPPFSDRPLCRASIPAKEVYQPYCLQTPLRRQA